ncbi:hypothetical protein [Paenibacillus naphthalenovorans]|uniref:hypothetical protein n=1 Tax=Paenibacillus naphthalenovorans TaxID=162209 RepID=UPI0008905A30|nr:hypothetical protein [Paenibacillus naphthalenovorans]SDJ60269.1 hypothetical protein SAMN05421868_1345 [Paenibacillus naphthalenovorans]
MDRLEEIKQRVKLGINEYMHDTDKAEIYRSDAEWLIEEVERLLEENADLIQAVNR